MSSSAVSVVPAVDPGVRLEVLFEELAELTGQRNAIDARVVQIVAEIDRDELWGATGARSVPALVAWKTGASSANAHTIAAVAHRLSEFPRCAAGLRAGRLSLDQVGVIAARAGEGSDAHYAELAESATVAQLRTAVSLEPRPESDPVPELESERSLTTTVGERCTTWRIRLPRVEAAKFDAALQAHREALVADWKHDRADGSSEQSPPFPDTVDRCVHGSGRGRLGHRGGPPPARAAHHGGGAPGSRGPGRGAASGSVVERRGAPVSAL